MRAFRCAVNMSNGFGSVVMPVRGSVKEITAVPSSSSILEDEDELSSRWRLLAISDLGKDFSKGRSAFSSLSCSRRPKVRSPRPSQPGPAHHMLIAFHKPYGVISQFTPDESHARTLSGFDFPRSVYPIGRLDTDSEGLLLLSDESGLNERLLHPRHAHRRAYWVQVERIPTRESLKKLEAGIVVQGRKTLPCRASLLASSPPVPPRDPPIRFRKTVPDCWIELELIEGKNRQVRRMTAAIGHPTLRLIRFRIGGLELGDLAPGERKTLSSASRDLVLQPGIGARPKRGRISVFGNPNGPAPKFEEDQGSDR